MVAQQRRPYRSEARARRAEETRERVIAAAGDLFTERGYAATSMRGIAAAAGVSLERVTATGSKSELLLAAFRRQLTGDDAAGLDLDLDIAAPGSEPLVVLRPAMRKLVAGMGRSLGIWRALTTAATMDEVVAHARAELVTQRRADIMALLRQLEDAGLTASCSARRRRAVADAVGLLVSHEAYEQLVTLCGWSERAYADWALAAVLAELGRPG